MHNPVEEPESLTKCDFAATSSKTKGRQKDGLFFTSETIDSRGLSPTQAKNQIALIRRDNREILRDAAFLFTTPRVTPRINSGCADLRAAFAASISPVSIAISTLLMNVRMRLRRLILVAVLLSSRRTRFFADDVFAIGFPLKRSLVLRGKLPGVKGS